MDEAGHLWAEEWMNQNLLGQLASCPGSSDPWSDQWVNGWLNEWINQVNQSIHPSVHPSTYPIIAPIYVHAHRSLSLHPCIIISYSFIHPSICAWYCERRWVRGCIINGSRHAVCVCMYILNGEKKKKKKKSVCAVCFPLSFSHLPALSGARNVPPSPFPPKKMARVKRHDWHSCAQVKRNRMRYRSSAMCQHM